MSASSKAMNTLLFLLAGLLVLLGIDGRPMVLIYPVWIVVYLLRVPLRQAMGRLPLSVSFVGCGVFFGMLTELFAVLNNLSIPPEKRILLSPEPVRDLVYGIFYYALVVTTWYLLLGWRRYARSEVFVLTGILGIFTEEMGQVLVRAFTVPVVGVLYALIVMTVYGIFPMLACLLNDDRFGPRPGASALVRYPAAAAALFVQWAAFGLLVLPALKRLV